MEWDDIVYLVLLFGSIGFGKVLRSIKCPLMKKYVATGVGLFIILVVSGIHIIHPIIFTFVNAVVITSFSYKIMHKISFAFSFGYLVFFRTTEYFGIPYAPAHTNLVMMILAFKMVGLAFEVHDSKKPPPPPAVGGDDSSSAAAPKRRTIEVPSFLDIFHYGFCYLGVLTGPYFTYRTYCDMFVLPFWKYAPCDSITLQRLLTLPLYALVFILFNYLFPFSATQGDDFYSETSIPFRIWYTWPLFVQFRMRMYIGMRLSECVLTMAGLGAYPEICQPKPTGGPTTNIEEIDKLSASEERAGRVRYNLVSAYNIEPYHTEFEITVRGAMKAWNISVQYWLAEYVYLRFPIKAYRTLVTFFISSLWHGVYAGYFLTICSVPLYLPVEDIYRRNLKDIDLPPLVWKVCRLLLIQWRMYIMGYWAVTFRLLTFSSSIRYWASIYFIPHLFTFIMYGIAYLIFKKPKRPKTSESAPPVQDSAKKVN